MSSPKLNNDGSISLSEWVGGGGMMVRRDALDVTHPEHPVNVIERLGEDPDRYGYRAERVLRDQLLAMNWRASE